MEKGKLTDRSMKKSIKTRLVLSFMMIIIITVLILEIVALSSTRDYYHRNLEDILKEYKGALERLSFIADRLIKIKENGFDGIEEIIPNKEGSYFCTDYDRTNYIVKRYFSARECNIREKQECVKAIQTLGRLHKAMMGAQVFKVQGTENRI